MKFLELETQRKIYNLIGRKPGLKLQNIIDALHIKKSLAEYQLQHMLKDELIVAVKDEGQIGYYLKDITTRLNDKRILDIRRKIYDLILLNPGLHLSKIAEMVNIRVSLAEYHLQFMEKGDGYVCSHLYIT